MSPTMTNHEGGGTREEKKGGHLPVLVGRKWRNHRRAKRARLGYDRVGELKFTRRPVSWKCLLVKDGSCAVVLLPMHGLSFVTPT